MTRKPSDPPGRLEIVLEFVMIVALGACLWVAVMCIIRPIVWVIDKITTRAA